MIEIQEENYIQCPKCGNEILPSELIEMMAIDKNKTLFGEAQTISCDECEQKLSVEVSTYATAEIKLIERIGE